MIRYAHTVVTKGRVVLELLPSAESPKGEQKVSAGDGAIKGGTDLGRLP